MKKNPEFRITDRLLIVSFKISFNNIQESFTRCRIGDNDFFMIYVFYFYTYLSVFYFVFCLFDAFCAIPALMPVYVREHWILRAGIACSSVILRGDRN